MSHCAPEATLKPKRFELTLKTVITDVFVAQVYWEAVPKMWPGGSEASVAKCVVRPWNWGLFYDFETFLNVNKM